MDVLARLAGKLAQTLIKSSFPLAIPAATDFPKSLSDLHIRNGWERKYQKLARQHDASIGDSWVKRGRL